MIGIDALTMYLVREKAEWQLALCRVDSVEVRRPISAACLAWYPVARDGLVCESMQWKSYRSQPCGGKVSLANLSREGCAKVAHVGASLLQRLIREFSKAGWRKKKKVRFCRGPPPIRDGSRRSFLSRDAKWD